MRAPQVQCISFFIVRGRRALVHWLNITCQLMLAALIVLATGSPATADAEASEIGAGGVIPRNEHNVSIENERLTIKDFPINTTILVEYDFLNHSNQDITTVVAFPIPDYIWPQTVDSHFDPGFEDFRVWVDGIEVKYDTQYRAMLNGHDYTNVLSSLGIDIGTHAFFYIDKKGNYSYPSPDYEIPKLPDEAQAKLKAFGLITDSPQWLVRKRCYWNQTFPAGKIVKMRHEYRSKNGITKIFDSEAENLSPSPDAYQWNLDSTCVPPDIRKRFKRHTSEKRDNFIIAQWVQYILTSANTWKKPIKNFELVINLDLEDEWLRSNRFFISFCWDGPVKKTDRVTYRAFRKDFVPDKELTVYCFLEDSHD